VVKFVKAQRIAYAVAALVRHHATSATERLSIQTMQAALLGTCRRHSCSLKNLAFTGSCQECGWVSLEQHRADKTKKGVQMPIQHQLQMMQQQQPCQVFQMPSMPPGVPIACGDSQGNFPILVNPAAFGENPSYGPIPSRVSAPSRPSPMMALAHQA